MILATILLTSCFKLLLIPSYRSTDFEVHRNWLAITQSLPVNKWYFEDTSEWTLDYPPLFAWFEYFLGFFAQLFDPAMLNVNNLNYASEATVLFQRLSVILVDLFYAYGIYQCSASLPKSWRSDVVLPLLLITNAGLITVDHIHFQYNGVLFGILLLSIARILQGQYLSGAFWFSFLLNMKHLYVYLAPAYFIYLLRNFCLNNIPSLNLKNFKNCFSMKNTARLGSLVIFVFAVTYAPFYDHLGQVLSRMFPFKRGLCHAYWAPNVWSIYNVIDKAASIIASRLGFKVTAGFASMTGGLVQEFSYGILPNISPSMTMLLIVLSIVPALVKLWMLGNKPLDFVRCMVICALSSFLFGWHVHEKAILMAIIPLSIVSVVEPGDAKVFVLLSTVGHYSLFPLLFPKSLLIIKVVIFILYATYAFYSLASLYPLQFCKYTLPLLNSIESAYVLGLIPVFLYTNFLHDWFKLSATLPFIPLMATSVYCSLGVIHCWFKYYIYFLSKTDAMKVKKKK